MDIKTFFKKLNYRWKRFRRRLNKQPSEEELAAKLPKLKAIHQLQLKGFIDVFFADETGFSLTPNIPYGWQKVGEQLCFTTQRKHIQNTFGLLNVGSKVLHSYSTKPAQMVNTRFICQSIDDFALKISKPTVIILDNAPWHKSNKFMMKIDQWQNQDLYIFHLPRYSPHLNLIETLWRKIKYEWLRPKDFNSKTALKRRLRHIFENFGVLFDINFSMNFYHKL